MARINEEKRCFEKYDDGCKYRTVIDTPFSKDWCNLKNDYCDNIRPENFQEPQTEQG